MLVALYAKRYYFYIGRNDSTFRSVILLRVRRRWPEKYGSLPLSAYIQIGSDVCKLCSPKSTGPDFVGHPVRLLSAVKIRYLSAPPAGVVTEQLWDR